MSESSFRLLLAKMPRTSEVGGLPQQKDVIMIERIGLTDRWSDAVVVGNLIFLSGHIAEKTRGQSVKVQTEEVLLDMEDTLAKAGVTKDNLVSVNIFLADMSGFNEMNEAWDAWVSIGHAPARATVESRLAHPDLAVEMTAVAAK